MGNERQHGYLTSEGLINKKDELESYYLHVRGWVVREGHARDWLVDHVAKDGAVLDVGASGGDSLMQLMEAGFNNL